MSSYMLRKTIGNVTEFVFLSENNIVLCYSLYDILRLFDQNIGCTLIYIFLLKRNSVFFQCII